MSVGNLIMGFDFGTKSIGVAIGQHITCTARPLISVKAHNGVPEWLHIKKLFKEWEPDSFVVGLPLNMDGSEQPFTIRVRIFSKQLYDYFGVKVLLHDERLSTIEARANLFEQGGYRGLEKGQVDARSAMIILNSWFESFR